VGDLGIVMDVFALINPIGFYALPEMKKAT
jgi:hypothetical protein